MIIGQKQAQLYLNLLITGAKNGKKLQHLLISGAPGVGKTLLSYNIANEIKAEPIYINAASITTPTVFRAPIVAAIKSKGTDKQYLIIIDEAHALTPNIQTTLLSALEEPGVLCTPCPRRIKLPSGGVINKGDILKEKLPPNITFVFLTTDKSRLQPALLSRLDEISLIEHSLNEKIEFIEQMLDEEFIQRDLGIIDQLAAIGKNLRHLKHLCETLITYVDANKIVKLTQANYDNFLSIVGIDAFGRSIDDVAYINCLVNKDTVSLSTISQVINMTESQVKLNLEPYMLRKGWLEITRSGRKLTQLGVELFGSKNNTLGDVLEIMNDS